MIPGKSPGAGDAGAQQEIHSGRNVAARNSRPASQGQVIRGELIGSDRCSALGTIATGHAPVLALARLLIEAGYDPATPLEAWRGDILALRIRSIGEGARLRTATHGLGFECLSECTAAPWVRKSTQRRRW